MPNFICIKTSCDIPIDFTTKDSHQQINSKLVFIIGMLFVSENNVLILQLILSYWLLGSLTVSSFGYFAYLQKKRALVVGKTKLKISE